MKFLEIFLMVLAFFLLNLPHYIESDGIWFLILSNLVLGGLFLGIIGFCKKEVLK